MVENIQKSNNMWHTTTTFGDYPFNYIYEHDSRRSSKYTKSSISQN